MRFTGWTRALTLRAKIIGLVVLLLVAMVGSGLYALRAMSMIGDELAAIAERDIPLTGALTHVAIGQLEQAVNLERALRYGESMAGDAQHSTGFSQAVDAFTRYSKEVDKGLQQGETLAQEAIRLAHSKANQGEFKKVLDGLKVIEQEHADYIKHAGELFELARQQRLAEAGSKVLDIQAEEEHIDHVLETLLLEIERFTEQAAVQAETHEHLAERVMFAILAVSLLAGALIAWWLIRDMTRRIAHAIGVAERVAGGDLRHAVETGSQDEIGRLLVALGAMRDSLHHMVSEMHESSNGLAVAAEELSTATNQMSSSVELQRAELAQAATAFTQMTATVQEVSRNAGSTAEATRDASKASEGGRRVICDAVSTIKQLASGVENAAGVIEQLGHDSEGIGAVIDVIKSIAEQTNLLALNAAIEAARAGEQGRGFAVVADEVRTLAQRTQQSTQEIEDMIARLQSSARNAVQGMENGREQAQQSVSKAMAAGESLEAINKAIAGISDMTTQIASAAEEQTAVSEDINRNLSSISEGAEQNVAAMTQTSGASVELARMAASLQGMIGRFQVA